MYEEIGRLKVELDWFKKNLTLPISFKRSWIEPEHETISIRRQCELLGLNRSTISLNPYPMKSFKLCE